MYILFKYNEMEILKYVISSYILGVQYCFVYADITTLKKNMLVLIIFIAFLYFYYIYSLIFIRQIHDGQLDVPIWFNKEMHFEEFQRRHDETTRNLSSFEGFISFFAMIVLKYTFNILQGNKKILYYCTWSNMERIVDEGIQEIDIQNCDVLLGVDYGGSIVAEYIKYKYKIKEIGYLRPRKKRSLYFIFFIFQLLFSYLEFIIFLFNPNVNWLPYFTEMEWVQTFSKYKEKRILIIDDGLLSGGTAKCCLNFLHKHYEFKSCNMLIMHGLNRTYHYRGIGPNKLHVLQKNQLCYLPWGQT